MKSAGDEIDRLVSRSRQLGTDQSLVVHGGGNTSSKTSEPDFRGRSRSVLRVKGSGTDLASITREGFPGLFLEDLLPLRDRATMSDAEMVEYLSHCMVEPGARAPSIETLLHAFLPARHVDHSHADAICALTNHPDGPAAVKEALGPDVAFIPYRRPGFDLACEVADAATCRAAVLEYHGLVTWGATGAESLELHRRLARAGTDYLVRRTASRRDEPTVDLTGEAESELLRALRKELSVHGPVVLHVDRRQRQLADRDDVAELARWRGTPDHMLRIGPRSAVARSAFEARDAVAQYVNEYEQYVARHRHRLPLGLPALGSLPRVLLVPGLGCVAAATTPAQAAVAADLALHSHTVTANAIDAFGAIEWLSDEQVFDFEHWDMELRKLAGAPKPPALAGMVVVLHGDGHAWAPATATLLRQNGAQVVDEDHGSNQTRTETAVLRYGGVDVTIIARERGSSPSPTVIERRGGSLSVIASDVAPPTVVAGVIVDLLARPGLETTSTRLFSSDA